MLRVFLLVVTLLMPVAGMAQGREVAQALLIPEVAEILRDEGVKSGMDIRNDLFPDGDAASWERVLERIHDPALMEAEFDNALDSALEGADTDAILGFLTSPLGKKVLRLEVDARRAFLDEGTEDAALIRLEEMTEEGDPRLELLRDFDAANDLTEMNVASALNGNLAFYRGMAASGVFDELTEEEMLSDVWTQEATIRADTREWLYSFGAVAYGPLTDAELQEYIDFSKTEAGGQLNLALFAAFDRVFTGFSYGIGLAAGQSMQGTDL